MCFGGEGEKSYLGACDGWSKDGQEEDPSRGPFGHKREVIRKGGAAGFGLGTARSLRGFWLPILLVSSALHPGVVVGPSGPGLTRTLLCGRWSPFWRPTCTHRREP